MDSILDTIKKLLGIPPNFTQFDVDIIIQINSAFSILRQLGVGPEEGFSIQDNGAYWEDFVDDEALEMLKTYVFQRVRLAFDPPATSFAIDAIKENIKELEWRLCSEMDERVWEEDEDEREGKNQNGKCFRAPWRPRPEMGRPEVPTVSKRPCRRKRDWCRRESQAENHHKEEHKREDHHGRRF